MARPASAPARIIKCALPVASHHDQSLAMASHTCLYGMREPNTQWMDEHALAQCRGSPWSTNYMLTVICGPWHVCTYIPYLRTLFTTALGSLEKAIQPPGLCNCCACVCRGEVGVRGCCSRRDSETPGQP